MVLQNAVGTFVAAKVILILEELNAMDKTQEATNGGILSG